jgi:flavin reductase (DIM6/NTAB) family NADH-FMN oxidoreductase RutF
MMADWTMQLSFEPRLVGVSLERNSTTLRNLRESGYFTINMLGADQRSLAVKFCQPREASKIKGRSADASAVIYDKMAGVPYHMGAISECPILDEAIAYVECQVHQLVEAGDHVLAIGRVLDGAILREGSEPLTNRILGWSYAG